MNQVTRRQIAHQIVRAIQGRSLNLFDPATLTEIASWERLLGEPEEKVHPPAKTVRLLRVIEYVGTPKFISDCIARRNLKGTKIIPGLGTMREALIGDTTEVINDADAEGIGICRPRTI